MESGRKEDCERIESLQDKIDDLSQDWQTMVKETTLEQIQQLSKSIVDEIQKGSRLTALGEEIQR